MNDYGGDESSVRAPSRPARQWSRPGRPRRRNGAATVEFAFVAPAFLMLVFGSIEFAHVFMVQHLLVNASREGARNAVAGSLTTEDVQHDVSEYLANLGIDHVDVTVTPDPSTTPLGQPVSVHVSVQFDQVSWLPIPKYFSETTLEAKTEMRRERPG